MELPSSQQFATPGTVVNPLVPEVSAEVQWTCPRPSPLLTPHTVPHTCRVPAHLFQDLLPTSAAARAHPDFRMRAWVRLGIWLWSTTDSCFVSHFHTSVTVFVPLQILTEMSSRLFKSASPSKCILCTNEICLLLIQTVLSLLLDLCAFLFTLSGIVMQWRYSRLFHYPCHQIPFKTQLIFFLATNSVENSWSKKVKSEANNWPTKIQQPKWTFHLSTIKHS